MKFEREDLKQITVLLDDGSQEDGILISKNKTWLYFWKLDGFTIDGRVLLRRSHVVTFITGKLSKMWYRSMKATNEFDKFDADVEVKLPESDKKVLKAITNDDSAISVHRGGGMDVGSIGFIGKKKMSLKWYKMNGKIQPAKEFKLRNVYMFYIDNDYAQTFCAFGK
jgi:hypothetical protein